MHETALRKTTNIPFPCLIFQLYRQSNVSLVAGVDNLIDVTQTQDVGLIKYDPNSVAQRRAPRPKVRLPEMFKGTVTEPSDDRDTPEENPTTREPSGADTMTSPPTTSRPTSTTYPQSVGLVIIFVEYL